MDPFGLQEYIENGWFYNMSGDMLYWFSGDFTFEELCGFYTFHPDHMYVIEGFDGPDGPPLYVWDGTPPDSDTGCYYWPQQVSVLLTDEERTELGFDPSEISIPGWTPSSIPFDAITTGVSPPGGTGATVGTGALAAGYGTYLGFKKELETRWIMDPDINPYAGDHPRDDPNNSLYKGRKTMRKWHDTFGGIIPHDSSGPRCKHGVPIKYCGICSRGGRR